MKHVIAAYGVVLVLLLALAREFEAAGWTGVSTLDVASAVVDALLVLAVLAGLLLLGQLGLDRWARSMERWHHRQELAAAQALPEAEVIGVTSWRQGARPLPLPQPAPSPPQPQPPPAPSQPTPAGFTYVGPSFGADRRATPPFPERPARRI